MVKTRAKADLIRRLDSNSGLAGQLATDQAPLRRLARAVPPGRPHRQGDQGRHPPRGRRDVRGDQPHGRHDREHAPGRRAGAAEEGGAQVSARADRTASPWCALLAPLPLHGAGRDRLDARSPSPPLRPFQPAAAAARRAAERPGDLPAGGPRAAAHPRRRPHPRRLARGAGGQGRARRHLRRGLRTGGTHRHAPATSSTTSSRQRAAKVETSQRHRLHRHLVRHA